MIYVKKWLNAEHSKYEVIEDNDGRRQVIGPEPAQDIWRDKGKPIDREEEYVAPLPPKEPEPLPYYPSADELADAIIAAAKGDKKAGEDMKKKISDCKPKAK